MPVWLLRVKVEALFRTIGRCRSRSIRPNPLTLGLFALCAALFACGTIEQPARIETAEGATMAADVLRCGGAVGFGASSPSPSRPMAEIRAGCLAGNGRDCHGLAVMIRRGQVAARDEGAAAGLLAYGCEFGSMESCGTLGRAYEAGEGVPRDAGAARALFDLACGGGLGEACADLARLRSIDPRCREAIEEEGSKGAMAVPIS